MRAPLLEAELAPVVVAGLDDINELEPVVLLDELVDDFALAVNIADTAELLLKSMAEVAEEAVEA